MLRKEPKEEKDEKGGDKEEREEEEKEEEEEEEEEEENLIPYMVLHRQHSEGSRGQSAGHPCWWRKKLKSETKSYGGAQV